MGESGWKSAQPTYRSLTKRPSSVSPAASHLPRRGRLKSFPFGRCVAQRIESNIAAGGSYTTKSGAGSALAETEEGRSGRERQNKSAQPTYRSLAKRPSSTTAYGGGPPSPEGKVKKETWGFRKSQE